MTTSPGQDLARGIARALVILAPALALESTTNRATGWTPALILAFLAGGATFAAALVAAAWIEEISPITFASDCRRWSFS